MRENRREVERRELATEKKIDRWLNNEREERERKREKRERVIERERREKE